MAVGDPVATRVLVIWLDGIGPAALNNPALTRFFHETAARGFRARMPATGSPVEAWLLSPTVRTRPPAAWRGETFFDVLARRGFVGTIVGWTEATRRLAAPSLPPPHRRVDHPVDPALVDADRETWARAQELLATSPARLLVVRLVSAQGDAGTATLVDDGSRPTAYGERVQVTTLAARRLLAEAGSHVTVFLVADGPDGRSCAAAGPGIRAAQDEVDLGLDELAVLWTTLLGCRSPGPALASLRSDLVELPADDERLIGALSRVAGEAFVGELEGTRESRPGTGSAPSSSADLAGDDRPGLIVRANRALESAALTRVDVVLALAAAWLAWIVFRLVRRWRRTSNGGASSGRRGA